MRIYFSRKAKGFYHEGVQDESPDDAEELSPEAYNKLMNGQTDEIEIAWPENGVPFLRKRLFSFEAKVEMLEDFLKREMNEAARARGYDSIATAISYAEEPANPRYQAEGRAFRAWRSLCWEALYEAVEAAGLRADELPLKEQLKAKLPKLNLPE